MVRKNVSTFAFEAAKVKSVKLETNLLHAFMHGSALVHIHIHVRIGTAPPTHILIFVSYSFIHMSEPPLWPVT